MVAAAAPVAISPAGPVNRPPRPVTVLLVDDSKVVRIKTSRLLEKHHYRVLLADDGLSALRCLMDEMPDLVITDVEMPGLDGFALTQRLRSEPRWHRLPVIMVTSADERHRSAALAAGVTVLLGKPYEEATLLAEVRAVVGQPAAQDSASLALQ